MREVGAAAMPIIPSFDGIKGQLEQGLNGPLRQAGTDGGRQFGDNAGKSLTKSLSGHAKKAALLATGALAGASIAAFKFGSDAVSLAADLEQSIGALDTVFGKSADQMHDWAKNAANDVGLTRNEFNELASLIGTQLKNAGTSMTRLAPKTNKLIKLGADLSSMFGGSTSEAVEALSSALKGERDPIEKYGVSLNEAAIKAEALQSGLVKTTKDASAVRQASIKLTVAQAKYNEEIRKHGKNSLEAIKAEGQLLAATDKFNKVSAGKVDELTNQQKQAATLSLIYKQTADAQGNFAKESDTLSGKQQRLKAALEDTKTEIGTALLPIVADAADFLLREGVPAFQKFADWFTDKGAPAIQDFTEDVKPLAKEIIPALGDGLEAVGGFLKGAAPLAKDLVGAFNNMPDWITDKAVLAALGLGIASKVRGGKGGSGGGPGGLLGGSRGASATNPMYVWVVNGLTKGGPAGGPVGGGAKGGPGLAGQLLTGAIVLSATPAQANSTKSAFGSIDPDGSLKELRQTLETDLGKYADDLKIDLDKLANELYEVGSNSEYVQTVLAKLDKAAKPGFWKDLTDGINPFSNKVGDIGTALDHINAELSTLDRRARDRKNLGDLEALAANDKAGNGLANLFGTDAATGKAFNKIPDAKLKVLQDPTTVKTREDVRKLLGDVDGLTRKDFRLIFSALGLKRAKDDAHELEESLRRLAGLNTSSSGYGPGFIGPVPSGSTRTAGRPSAAGLRVENVTINSLNANRLISDLLDIQRRTSIGGY